MERVILHCDANAFYASVECLYTPSIRHRPVAVCGSVEERHGIVLTKNQIAKQFGVQTGEAIWQARQKCPDLICVPPDYGLYIEKVNGLEADYNKDGAYWALYMNGEYAQNGIDTQPVRNKDEITLSYEKNAAE